MNIRKTTRINSLEWPLLVLFVASFATGMLFIANIALYFYGVTK